MKKYLLSFALLATVLSGTSAFGTTHPQETEEVLRFLETNEVFRITNYCSVGSLNCRSLVQFKNKKSGRFVQSFEDRFIASETGRSVAVRAFFLRKPNGKFKVYVQDNFKNEIDISRVDNINPDVTVTFDQDLYPTFNLEFLIIGTPDTKRATLRYTAHTAEMTGELQGVRILKP